MSDKPPDRLGDRVSETTRGISLGLELPFVLIACIAAGGGAGYLLDRALHTSPTFTLIIGALGFLLGIFTVIRRLKS